LFEARWMCVCSVVFAGHLEVDQFQIVPLWADGCRAETRSREPTRTIRAGGGRTRLS